MKPTFIAYTNATGTGDTISLAIPSSAVPDDLMLVYVDNDLGGGGPTFPAGWTVLHTSYVVTVAWKILEEGEASPVIIHGGTEYAAALLVYRYTARPNPIESVNHLDRIEAMPIGTIVYCPGVTLLSNNSLWLMFGSFRWGANGGAWRTATDHAVARDNFAQNALQQIITEDGTHAAGVQETHYYQIAVHDSYACIGFSVVLAPGDPPEPILKGVVLEGGDGMYAVEPVNYPELRGAVLEGGDGMFRWEPVNYPELRGAVLELSAVTGSAYYATMSGGAVTGGSAGIAHSLPAAMSGGAVVGGSVGVALGLPFTMAGGSVAGGSATVALGLPAMMAGGAVAGGAATVTFSLSVAMSGGAVAGGSAAIGAAFAFTMAGGASSGGAATALAAFTAVMSGGAVTGGAATFSFVVVHLLEFYIGLTIAEELRGADGLVGIPLQLEGIATPVAETVEKWLAFDMLGTLRIPSRRVTWCGNTLFQVTAVSRLATGHTDTREGVHRELISKVVRALENRDVQVKTYGAGNNRIATLSLRSPDVVMLPTQKGLGVSVATFLGRIT